MLKLGGVILGAPRESFYIKASLEDGIDTLQEKVQSENPNRLGHLDTIEINLWKVVVGYSNVLFKLLITLT